jgi:acetyl esterase/lipase
MSRARGIPSIIIALVAAGCANAGNHEPGAGGHGDQAAAGGTAGGRIDGAGGSAMGSGGAAGGSIDAGASGGSGPATSSGGAGGASRPSGAGGATSTADAGDIGGGHVDAGSSPDARPVLKPPVPDTSSPIPISRPGGQFHVEGNLPYGPLPAQRLDVIYPPGAGPNGTMTLPGVIMFHGGGWIEGDKQTMSSFYNRFLAHGFLVCNVEYRVADGSATGAIAPAAVQDALLAAKWFWDYLDYYHVDRSRYIVTGASAGGNLALMVGMATPAAQLGPTSPTDYKIAAIVNGYGPPDVTDLLNRGTSFAVQWLPASVPNRAALALRVSPLTYARADIPPLITVQGANDTTVPVAENQHLDQVLKAAGADAQIHLVPGAGHGFATPATAYPDAEMAMFGFLVAHGIGK